MRWSQLNSIRYKIDVVWLFSKSWKSRSASAETGINSLSSTGKCHVRHYVIAFPSFVYCLAEIRILSILPILGRTSRLQLYDFLLFFPNTSASTQTIFFFPFNGLSSSSYTAILRNSLVCLLGVGKSHMCTR